MQTLLSPTVGRRIVATLFITQSLALAGFIANVAVNAIVGAELSGTQALSGLPGTLMLLGAATAAYPAGWLMQRLGRRPGLTLGFIVGAIGMLVSGSAVLLHTFPLFLLGTLLIGASRGTLDQSRYAAADAQPVERRGKAISTIVFAGTIGAIAGPALVGRMGRLVEQFGFDPLAGPMLIGVVLFAMGGALVFMLLRPDPRDIARALAGQVADVANNLSRAARPWRQLLGLPAVRLALAAMVFGQVVMVTVMSMVSLHMFNHDHPLDDISLVVAAHTLGMFGLSVVTGALVDRFGQRWVIGGGACILIAGCVLAPFSLLTPWLAAAQFLVGLGWNFCYIAGSSLLAEALAPSERGSAQGAADLTINFASATSSLSSGFVMHALGFTTLCVLGVVLAMVPLAVLGWQSVTRPPHATYEMH